MNGGGMQEDNMSVINAFMREAAAQAVADVIREHNGDQLSLAQGMPKAVPAERDPSVYAAERDPSVYAAERDPSVYAVDNVGRAHRPRTVTVSPIEDSYQPAPGWFGRSPLWWAVFGVCLTVAGLLVWGVISIILAIGTAVVAAGHALPSIIVMLVIAAIVLICLGGRGGGGTFSGTFSGRMH